MTDSTQFEMGCEACEAMCLDAVDGTLTAAEAAVFDRHVAGCVECAEQLSEARRGAAWMEMLKGHRPEPPAGMLQRILAQTSEAEMSRVFPRHGVVPTPRFDVVPVAGYQERLWDRIEAAFRFNPGQTHFQPRLAMTAAMAFFSIALTLNLGGVRLTDLRPGAIQRSVGEARASMARQIQGMKVVYQVESRVNELRDDDLGSAGRDNDSRGAVGSSGGASGAPRQPAAKPDGSKAVPQDEKVNPETPKGSSELIVPSPGLQKLLSGYGSGPEASREPQAAAGVGVEVEKAAGAEAPRVQKGA